MFTAPFRYAGNAYQVPTIVVRDLSYGLILGYDFWKIVCLKIAHQVDEIQPTPETDIILKSPTTLTPAQQHKFEEAKRLFLITTKQILGRTPVLRHEIELVDGTKPFYASPNLFSPEMDIRMGKESNNMLDHEMMAINRSLSASPVVLIEKLDVPIRLSLDRVPLNTEDPKERRDPNPLIIAVSPHEEVDSTGQEPSFGRLQELATSP